MRFYSETLGLSSAAFALLRDLIHERTGLCYDDGKSGILADRLSPRVVEYGFNSFLDYYYLLKYDDKADDEWQRVMDALAVPETYFWREFDQVRALVNALVPAYFASKNPEPLRIWSAACSGGEEPLTIAMALAEAGWLERAPIEIYASDASPKAIARARAGLYQERSFRNLSPQLRARYFTHEAGGERVLPSLQARIRWQVANLISEADVRFLARVNIIFCRNVFIYFSQNAICKVVNLFTRYLLTPGYLMLGSSESLLRITNSYELQEIEGAFIYVRR
jgi:chemotaxis protein methyltransferase CheR